MIIAGKRRWRAAQIAGLAEAQIIVRPGLTGMNFELAQLAENLQREDLTDLDVASSIGDMMERYPELRKLINRSPSYITRMLAMIDPQWKSLVLSGEVTYASVLEAFKGKSQAVRDLAISSSKASGKPITHDALRAAEQQLLRVENSVAIQPELYDKLMADMGFGAGPTPGLSLAMDASGATTTSSLASTRIRGGNANDS
jgi:ParB-like chromosome segregation protein Spo0J